MRNIKMHPGAGMSGRDQEDQYHLTAVVAYEGNSARIQFPTEELREVLESIGILLPPERVYLGGYTDLTVSLQKGDGPVVDALVCLFGKNNSLRMVNEVAKAVFHADWRVYERVEEQLKKGYYHSAEDVLRDAVDYGKYIKSISAKKKSERNREER